MTIDRGRRRLLVSTTALAGVSAFASWPPLACAARLTDASEAFDFDQIIDRARKAATRPYDKPEPRHTKLLDELGYDAFMGIHSRTSQALWAGEKQPFAVEFFHLDQNARDAVNIHVVANGRSRRVRYQPSLFRYDDPGVKERLPEDLGFAGFRLIDQRSDGLEWLAFKGASYFRSPGSLNQYGLSARGIAIDTGYGDGEQFPRFSDYWLVKPEAGDESITLYALLTGENITGAYRMVCSRPGEVIMDIQAHLFQRTPVRRLGVAPLTSMFWFSETNARVGTDWRPEVHDSDGLAIHTGKGQRIWRALANPPRTHYSAFSDQGPRGFGLIQRDRMFDHYQDPDVGFERRPSLWVEPNGDWGKGHIGLLELPTNEEIYDNVNAFWVPNGSESAGTAWQFDYRLLWTDRAPFPAGMARAVATRTGRAGEPGTYDQQAPTARKFVVEFDGGALGRLQAEAKPSIHVEASHGRIVNPYLSKITDSTRWHAFFDWTGSAPADDQPVELRCYIAHDGTTLTETWTYAYFPEPLPGHDA
ncbi:glucan biosynthesis protein [Salinisphaera sp. T31B1]|uniref:glucan biosynthesis protein n=1 Tax=Salinisphaera sp. T31B1 TaxID=727963 RepID=UPI003342A0F8